MDLFSFFQARANPRFHGETYGTGALNEAGKLADLDTRTKFYPLTPQLFDDHLAGKLRLGVGPLFDDGTARFGAIDFDSYKDDESILKIVKVADETFPDLVPVRSKSGGLHLYYFGKEPLEASSLIEYFREVRHVLGMPPNTEIFPKTSTPNLKPRTDAGGWLHLPYSGDSGHAVAPDGTKLSLDQFIALCAERECTDDAREKARSIKARVPKADYKKGNAEGNRYNGLKSAAGIYVQENPKASKEDVVAWLNTEWRANQDPPVPQSEWQKWNIPKLAAWVVGRHATSQKMTRDQKAHLGRLVTFAVNLIKAAEKTDEEIQAALRARNDNDLNRVEDDCMWWVLETASQKVEEQGAGAGKKAEKPTPMFNAVRGFLDRYDVALDAAYRAHYYDPERYLWTANREVFDTFLIESYKNQSRCTYGEQEVITFLWTLARDESRTLWEVAPTDRINLRNGILDLKTLQLTEHGPESMDFLFPNQYDLIWDPKAKCPQMDKFLDDVLGPEGSLFYEILGYLLVPDLTAQKAFLLQGKGGNGKSIFLEVIRQMLGDENCSAVSFHDLESNRFAASSLVGKMLNLDTDITTKAIPGSQKFMKITSGIDKMSVEQKFMPMYDVRLYSRLMFSCNSFPRCNNDEEGFWDRWVVLVFNRKAYREGQANHTEQVPHDELLERLMSESSGILRKAVEAYQEMRKRPHREFTKTPQMKEWMETFRFATDSLAVWMRQHTVLKEGATMSQARLRMRYSEYCEKNDIKKLDASEFSMRLQLLFPSVTSEQNPHGDWVFGGLGEIDLNQMVDENGREIM